jgi:XTP/dITP diphosphohydrolase
MKRIVVASSNRGKLTEIAQILEGTGYALIEQSALRVGDAEETGLSFVENALLKARHAALKTDLPALGDDSGLIVDALNGAPGLHSARYSGGHGNATHNIERLLRELDGVPPERRGARFHCVIVLLRHATDPAPLIAEGAWRGRILDAPRGSGGFGYDPVFFDPAFGRSAAELDAETKNRVSHRGRALTQLRALLAAPL